MVNNTDLLGDAMLKMEIVSNEEVNNAVEFLGYTENTLLQLLRIKTGYKTFQEYLISI